jgi:hypothetical protein
MLARRPFTTFLFLIALFLAWGAGSARAQVKAVISGDSYYVADHTGHPADDGTVVYFEGTQSEGEIVNYVWDGGGDLFGGFGSDGPYFDAWVGGASRDDDFPFVAYCWVSLYVEDSEGNWDYTEKYFYVEFRNSYPVVNAGPDQWFFAPQGLNVTLHGSAYDPDGDSFYAGDWWIGGDNYGGRQWDPTLRLFPGVNTITLTVLDTYSRYGSWGTDEVVVTVYGSWIDSLSKTSTYAGEFPPTLTVTGQAFRKGAVITWNGQSLPTTWLSPTQLRTKLTAEQVAQAGVFKVGVNNPYWENWIPGGFSNTVDFTVLNRVPAISSLSPNSVVHGSPTFTITVTGARFVTTSTVNWNGSPRPTVYNSPTSLSVTIYDTDVATAGRAAVTVVNPAPGGGASPAKYFHIQ